MRVALISVFVAVLSVYARPSPQGRASAFDDATILNYALTLEHLENAFYMEALDKFNAKAFTDAGFPSWVRGRFVEIGQHEQAHVAFLSSALGDKATKPCKYNFPYTDPKSFVALSQALEGVGVSAYIGAAQYISNKEYLTAAASVLSTEARHASWVASSVNGFAGWSGALDVPLSLNEVYTLAAAFITSCPSTNPNLPVKAFPTLTLPATSTPGATVPVTYKSRPTTSGLFVAFFTGLSQEFAPVKDGKVTIPKGLRGQVYAIVTTNDTMVSDDNTVAGPAILEFNFDSSGDLQ